MAQQFGRSLSLEAIERSLELSPVLTSGSLFGGGQREPQTPAAKENDLELIAGWLDELSMLKGVPFNYLVADMAMLPAESLRFFQVDRNWIYALADGAFSLGVTGLKTPKAENEYCSMRDTAAANVEQCRVRGAMRATQLGDRPEDILVTQASMSGFLLRSQLLDAWPGLEVEGFGSDADKSPLSIVRMERVAPGVLLCLFNRPLGRVRFKGPAESGHLGVGMENGKWVKRPRPLATATGSPPLEPVPVPLRSGGRRVIALASLAGDMKARNAAEFAVQLTEGTELIDFTWSTP